MVFDGRYYRFPDERCSLIYHDLLLDLIFKHIKTGEVFPHTFQHYQDLESCALCNEEFGGDDVVDITCSSHHRLHFSCCVKYLFGPLGVRRQCNINQNCPVCRDLLVDPCISPLCNTCVVCGACGIKYCTDAQQQDERTCAICNIVEDCPSFTIPVAVDGRIQTFSGVFSAPRETSAVRFEGAWKKLEDLPPLVCQQVKKFIEKKEEMPNLLLKHPKERIALTCWMTKDVVHWQCVHCAESGRLSLSRDQGRDQDRSPRTSWNWRWQLQEDQYTEQRQILSA